MKTAVLIAVAFLSVTQDTPQPPKPQKEQEWLLQFVGEWDTEGEAVAEPGKPPVKTKGTVSIRAIGGLWVQCEHKGDFFGTPFTGVLTLGYDPAKKKYVGTWTDSIMPYLWKYEGTLDEAGKILTLETEGPGHEPGMTKFREMVEVKSKDHTVFASMAQKNGQWVQYLTMNQRRKK